MQRVNKVALFSLVSNMFYLFVVVFPKKNIVTTTLDDKGECSYIDKDELIFSPFFVIISSKL